ncbi:MAG: VWA domain-containing protein [Elusimicrobia bacterium]|nr:VWA domain-containing protein [Elusimicrobiota bacterium]MDD7578155.1 VWA domain-containing protein [Elusimicrobiota bacterium]MDY6040001.1 VWA domain-containing protein [Elusimicrobiaceae bacterium]
MIYFFIISTGLLLGTLATSLFVRRDSKFMAAAILCAAALTFTAACALIFTRIAGEQAGFMTPWAFVLLVIPFGVFLAQTVFRGAFARRINYSMARLKVQQASLRVLFTRWLPLTLYTAALILMTVALARPVRIDRTVLPPSEGIDIILLMDVSASMQKQDFYPSRFVAAQQTAARFISKRVSDRIGVVAFAKAAMLQAPLTLDHDALQEYISSLYLGIVDPNYTAIGDALGVAANHLKDSKAKSKVIILLTDGDSNAGAIEPLMAAKAAAAYGIRVYTVGTASAPGSNPYSNQADEINEGLMMEIAELTGGKYYRANNESELTKIYDTINELEKTEFSPSSTVSRTDYFQSVLLLALLCAALGLALEKLILIKVP